MNKERLGNELLYTRVGYKSDRWKWVLDLPKLRSGKNGALDSNSSTSPLDALPSAQQLRELDLLKCYGLDKVPKILPCLKRCPQNPWCVGGLKAGSVTGKAGSRLPLHQQKRTDFNIPVGLQNTANTCWINSALQLFYHLRKFRNALNSVDDFIGEESLDSLLHLLQIVFAEMESHPHKAMACEPGSVFEKLGMFASREIMNKDVNNELLKCVSEFMENTIDLLIAEHRLASRVAPLFTITLTRVARWQCSKCSRLHEYELAPASSYTMGAYISADQAPLQQCLMDLQAETQTGVLMVCGGGGGGRCSKDGEEKEEGCGAGVKVDRVVTPKLGSLPTYLIIRNNSLIAEDVKRRLHVVYPEKLDLSSHTLDGRAACYQLCGVVFHHGYWVKHYSAQVRTEEGAWFSFNDENVMEMTFKSCGASLSNPLENHPNYFSLGSVSAKFKGRSGERVSRGAFIWLYTLMEDLPPPPLLSPPSSISQFVADHRSLHKGDKSKELTRVQAERQALLQDLAVTDPGEPYVVLSESLLLAWLSSQECQFVAQASSLPQLRCEHGNIKPLLAHALKFVQARAVDQLLTHRCGIHVTLERSVAEAPDWPADTSKLLVYSDSIEKKVNSNGTSSFVSVNGVVHKASSGFNDSLKKSIPTNTNASVASNSLQSASEEIITRNHQIPSTKLGPFSNHLVSSENSRVAHLNSEVKLEKGISVSTKTKVESEEIPAVAQACRMSTTENGAKKEVLGMITEESNVRGAMKALQMFPDTQHQCRECVSRHARHILFLERLRLLHKQCKKEALRQHKENFRAVGAQSLDLWPKLATRRYIKMHGIDMIEDMCPSTAEEEGSDDRATQSGDVIAPSDVTDAVSAVSPVDSQSIVDEQNSVSDSSRFQLFNEDLVCSHQQLNTQAVKFYLPPATYEEILKLIGEDIHPVTVLDDFQPCLDCQNVLDATESACERGIAEKNDLPSLFADKKRPSLTRDAGAAVYLLDRDVFDEWRTYVRGCTRGVIGQRPKLSNDELLCEHKKLSYNPLLLEPMRCSLLWVLVWPAEWLVLEQLYGHPEGGSIRATVSPAGLVDIIPGVCDRGCVESRAQADYEDQFEYECELIYVRQVHSVVDIPLRAIASTRSMGPSPNPAFALPLSSHVWNKAISDRSCSNSAATSTSPDCDGNSDIDTLSNQSKDKAIRNNILETAVNTHMFLRKNQNGTCTGQAFTSHFNSRLVSQSVSLNEKSDDHRKECMTRPQSSDSCEKRTMDDVDMLKDNGSSAPSKHAKLELEGPEAHSKGNSQISSSSSSQTVVVLPAAGVSSVETASCNHTLGVRWEHTSPSCSSGTGSTVNLSFSSAKPSIPASLSRSMSFPSSSVSSTVLVTSSSSSSVSASLPTLRQSGRLRVPRPRVLSSQHSRDMKLSKTAAAKLVRASKTFSSTDTVRQVQNFIAERTGVWPMLQTVWLVWSEDLAATLSLPPGPPAPVLLTEQHLTMTLGALRILPGDTIYFKAAKEDMEKAAGDGIMEFEELPV
ncbi:Peptidase C19 ubiquitin carboxyl-terminal hydrolase [Trinorchestia longiramus]|nr:Peptidase C19 ubiquitin carboxyl-terminal hydrolase [Trinorchestia longiramus]